MLYVGVDLGGTNIAAGLVSPDGKVLIQDSVPTGVGRSYQEILASMGSLINDLVKKSGYGMHDIEAVGIGSPGAADMDKGEIVFANNLYWYNVPICSELQKHVQKPVYVDNDANVAALAELAVGCAKGRKSLVLLTLGTGVGAGIVMDGKIVGGSHHVGAEIGHMIMDVNGEPCTCGNQGCFERYTSATALIRDGRHMALGYPDCLIMAKASGNLDNITAKIVIDAAREGDELAMAIFDKYVRYLALGIINIINILDPEVVALGGGVSKAGDFLLDKVRAVMNAHIFYKKLAHADIMLSPLGNDAGVIGAAMLAVSGRIA